MVLHVRNTYTPTSAPYVAFIDATGSLGQKNWPKWAMSDRDHRARVRLESTYFTHALLVATAGEYVIEELQRTYNQPAAKLASVGGGTSFLRGPEKAFRGGCEVRFLFVGGEFDRKGGRELLGAFRRLRESFPKVTLTIVGPPVPSEAEDGVDWQGFVKDRGRVRALYSSADVFCLPSRWEPYGLAVQEALAHGLPCIVSDQGALPEIVGEAGVVVRVGSEDDIFDAMQKLVHDESYRRSLAAAAPDRLEGRTWGDVTDRLLTAIAGALDASGSSYS